MWLIDTHSLALKRFQDDRKAVGKYAILSHRWQHEEVTFDDLPQGRNVLVPEGTRSKLGFAKIENACAQAREGGYRYLWADTACIDKQSSAELSEAIASMWRWYSDAAVCYAYLCDIEFEDAAMPERDEIDNKAFLQLLRPSVWFRRGWTLQELIAPSEVVFFDKTWRRIGFKTEMSKMLETITGIAENALLNRDMVNAYCVAKRMAWAARRETARVEDEAYCLLGQPIEWFIFVAFFRAKFANLKTGLFNVSMPMMYGEGRRAFLRLQEEIARSSIDHSIFAWKPSPTPAASDDLADYEPLELTKQALRICLPVHVEGDRLFAVLNCVPRKLRDRDEAVVLVLKKHERQDRLVPKLNSRIVCEIERSSIHPSRISCSALEPLEWTELTILRNGLTSEVTVEFRLERPNGFKIIGSDPALEQSGTVSVLKNPTGGPFSGGCIILGLTPHHGQPTNFPVYLSFGQCLLQEDSFATFRIHWSIAPMTEHRLFLQQPATVASAWILDGLMTAQAVLLPEPGLHNQRPRWVVRIWAQENGVMLHKEPPAANTKPHVKLEKELSKLKKEYRRGVRRLERTREDAHENNMNPLTEDDEHS